MTRPTLRKMNTLNRLLSRADELHEVACRLNLHRDGTLKQLATEIKDIVRRLRKRAWDALHEESK